MELFKRMEPDFTFCDERGVLVQLVHMGYEQVNVLVSKAGVTRGKHYHKETIEAFFVVNGMVSVDFEQAGESCTETFRQGEFFCVFPGVRHTMHFTEETILVALYERGIERADGKKDIFSD